MPDITQIQVDNTAYDIRDDTARAASAGKVSKSGDTMTGTLEIQNDGAFRVKNDAFDISSAPASNVSKGPFNVRDASDNIIASVRVFQTTGNHIGIGLNAMGNDILSGYVDSQSGYVDSYNIADPGKFRNALGASQGIFPTSMGGTGGTDSGWLELTNSTVFTGSLYYRKIGSLVEVRGAQLVLQENLTTSNMLLTTMPSGYTTFLRTIFTAYYRSTPINTIMYTGGNIYISVPSGGSQLSSGGNLYIQGMYYVTS